MIRRVLAAALASAALLQGCRCDTAEPAAGLLPAEPPLAAPANTGGEAAGIRYIEVVTGGAKSTDALPLIVDLHGLGGTPQESAKIFTGFRTKARVALLYGIFPVEGGGYAWFRVAPRRAPEDFAGARDAAVRVAAAITEIARVRPTEGKPIVTGFSQGGAVSFAIAALAPEVIEEAVPVAAFLPPGTEPPNDAVERPRIVAFHGTTDDRIPIAWSRTSVETLRSFGYPVELREYPTAHSMTEKERADFLAELSQATERAAARPSAR